MNAEGKPRKSVIERIFDTKNVIPTARIISAVNSKADTSDDENPTAPPTKNIDKSVISKGNLPLQGTKELVSIAIILSLGESMIRQPTTPVALHPNPIHIVSACLPQLLHFLNGLSRLNATRGRYPESSSRVNKGKNIAIGGSITDTIQASVRYAPSIKTPHSHSGVCIWRKRFPSLSPMKKSAVESHCDG